MAVFSKIATGLLAMAASAAALERVVAKGSNFVYENSGDRFEIIGVAYQPGGSAGYNPGSGIDPLSDGKSCLRDAAIMQKLGVNTIRVYNLDPDISHDDCASVFNAAGIYMILDVNSPLQGQSINAAEPWTTYTKDYLTRVFKVIESFKNYDNLIGFFSGNEIINDMNSGKIDPPYIRAVTRDMKNYIAKQCDRAIPVGYSAADVREILTDTNNYLQCSNTGNADDPERIDFFGLNSYSWCGNSDMKTAGYDTLMQDFSQSTIPVFFSEYGCNAVHPRPFTEVAAIYGPDMTGTFSGAIAYEYTQEANDFGLVKIASDGSATLLQDYDNLKSELGKLDMNTLRQANMSATAQTPEKCSPSLIKNSSFNNNFTIPATPDGVQDLIDHGVPGAKTGHLSAPSATACPDPVTGSDGQKISGLAIDVNPANLAADGPASNSTGSSRNSTGAYGDKAGMFIGTGTAGSAGVRPTGNSTAGDASKSGPSYVAATQTPTMMTATAGSGSKTGSADASHSSGPASSAGARTQIVGAGSMLALVAAVVAFL